MRLLIKIGSALISREQRLNYPWMQAKVKEIAALHRRGDEIIIVSSGAVAAGMEVEQLDRRPGDTLKVQLLAGEGQIKLMRHYKDYFAAEGILIAQVLLTHHNFSIKEEEQTIGAIMEAYLGQGTIPIINENDLVNKEELEYKRIFTDNDILAALVAVRMKVDRLLILTDVEGLHQGDPKKNHDAVLIELVPTIDQRIKQAASRETNPLGLGGMYSKVMAAEMVTAQGIETIVASGYHALAEILNRRVRCTVFEAGCRVGDR